MPAGLDTVVPQGIHAGRRRNGPHSPNVLQRGDNRRLLGEDLMAGRATARRQLHRPTACGLLAVWAWVRCLCFGACGGVFFDGRRDPQHRRRAREGAVYDSNRYTVFGLLTRLGCEVIDLGVVRDEPALLEAVHAGGGAGRCDHHQRRRRGRGRLHPNDDEAAR